LPPKLAIIVPCYNEEEILQYSHSKLSSFLQGIISTKTVESGSRIFYVDDGSGDKTWEVIEELSQTDELIEGIKLSRNFGHQFALLAGLETLYQKFDIYISIDADLQDDIRVMERMVQQYNNGSSIVYGVRSNRSSDSFFKRQSAQGFYKFMSWLGVKTVYNHADFRLADNKALRELIRFGETNLFLRGIFPLIGLKHSIVEYSRSPRKAGRTKYPLRKIISFAWEGITSFSIKPLRLILYLGIMFFLTSIALAIWALIVYLEEKTIPGWTSMIIPMVFFGGFQMIFLGVIGEYIGKIYKEVKARPRYIVEKRTSKN
jgi:glycosyltransferase involved in cell wall biosynthesis